MIILWNKQKGTGGSGGGGTSFPTIVTDSGSSLPAKTGFQLNDTFLNTTDKKLYKILTGGYKLINYEEPTSNFGLPDFDAVSGVISGFMPYISNYQTGKILFVGSSVSSTLRKLWYGQLTVRFHIQLSDIRNDNNIYTIGVFANQYQSTNTSWGITIKNSQLYWGTGYNISATTKLSEYLFDDTTKHYYIEINKLDETYVNVKISNTGYGQDLVADDTVECPDYYSSFLSYSGFAYGSQMDLSVGVISPIKVYLTDSYGSEQLIVADPTQTFWDSGTDITDKTEYADKTNGILYLYENSELVKIGGSLTKKVYTISADNTSTLDVSSDFTKVVDVLKNGVELALTDDYTISSGVITFVTALSTTDKITVKGE